METPQEEGLAALAGGGHAGVFVDFHRVVVRAGEGGERRYVAVRAVGVACADGEGDADVLSGHDHLRRLDLDAGGLGDFAFVILGAVTDPADEGFVERAVRREKFPAGMGDGADGFCHEQGIFRDGEVDSSAGHFRGEAVVVALGIEAVEAEVEAVLPARGAVAGAGVAARGGEHGHDVELEGNGAGLGRVFHSDRALGGKAAILDVQFRFAVGLRGEEVII